MKHILDLNTKYCDSSALIYTELEKKAKYNSNYLSKDYESSIAIDLNIDKYQASNHDI